MTHLFVPYAIAVMAKEKGFDEPCMCYYNDDKNLCVKQGDVLSGILNQDCHRLNIVAPLYQQLTDWLRAKHKLHIDIVYERGDWHYRINQLPSEKDILFAHSGECEDGDLWLDASLMTLDWHSHEFKNYCEAYNQALIEAFKLI